MFGMISWVGVAIMGMILILAFVSELRNGDRSYVVFALGVLAYIFGTAYFNIPMFLTLGIPIVAYFIYQRMRKTLLYKTIFWGKRARESVHLFRALASEKLDSFYNDRYPPCKEEIMKEIDVSILNSKEDFQGFKDGYDYEELVLNVIANIAFSLVSTGQYHVYRGVLKPIGIQFKTVYVRAIEEAHQKGYLSGGELKERIRELSTAIEEVG